LFLVPTHLCAVSEAMIICVGGGGGRRRQDSLFLSYRACGERYGERRALRGYRVLDMDMPLTLRTESRNIKRMDWGIVSLRNMLSVDCMLFGVHDMCI